MYNIIEHITLALALLTTPQSKGLCDQSDIMAFYHLLVVTHARASRAAGYSSKS